MSASARILRTAFTQRLSDNASLLSVLAHASGGRDARAPGFRARSLLDACEVYEAALRVCRDELDAHAVADAEAARASHDHAVGGRACDAREDARGLHARND